MNGWISIIFSVLGGVALLMKSKMNENGGGFTVVKDGDTTAPSPSSDQETPSERDVTVKDVIEDPSLLDDLKFSDPSKYEEITKSIYRDLDSLKRYVRDTQATTGEYFAPFANKEVEVLRILQEGFGTEYVGKSMSGEYFVEVFTKKDENIGWRGGEKVGIIIYEVLMNLPDEGMVRIRDYMLGDEELPDYERYIAKLNKYITL